MTELHSIRCIACEGDMPALTPEKIKELLSQVKEWKVSSDNKKISRRFTFKGFYKTMAFVNAIAYIAHRENHHPDMEVGYNYCLVTYFTHSINGLTQNDFICAAKIDALDG